MVEFLAVVGGLAICVVIGVAVACAIGGVQKTMKRIASLEADQSGASSWLRQLERHSNDVRYRLKKLEDAIGPSEPIQ